MEKRQYDNESISSLKGADRVRKRPAVIFGSDGIEGCQHSVFEIISNSIDEAREGFGTKIEICYYEDGSLSVKDYGRGIPVDFNQKEDCYNWQLLFCELYAGGKFSNVDEQNYSFSLGLNGLGLCSTQYSSEYMDVEIFRDNFRYTLHFEKGYNIGGLKKEKTDISTTSTFIKWKPDKEVFTSIDIQPEFFVDVLKRQAIVNAGLLFEFIDKKNDTKQNFIYENGIKDYIEEISKNKNFTSVYYFNHEAYGQDRDDKPKYKLKFDIGFCFNNEVNLIEYYHNSSYLEHGGSPDKAVRSAFLSAIDNYLRENNLYKKDEKKIIFQDIEDSLILISNSFSTSTSYENQTKKSITNKFIQDEMTNYLKKQLKILLIENKIDAQKICMQILANKRSRELAERTRINIKKKLTGNIDINNRVEKFVNCRSKDITKREIYIVEGDSALGACKLGRDSQFQAIMPIRGKILNCLKASLDKIMASKIIIDLVKVLGCGIEIKSKHNDLDSFDLNKLRWSKIIICTDADVDGFQIRTLILTMVYCLMPTLINEKKVFIAESPLYEINYGKKTYFAYSEKEKFDIINKLTGKYTILRSKGLGENEPDMMWQTTMNPQTRKLIQVLPEDIAHTQKTFDMLLGTDLESRKNFIAQYGYKYLDLIDVS
jgi:Type IIA topoisomerase (DNA gyrase/topo II, topoisomerase IV), B subunit